MNHDLKSELYKTFAAQYTARHTCWTCRATGMRLSNPGDRWHDKEAPRVPCEACSGGYIECAQDTAAERAAVAFYKEWIACRVVERKYPKECAFQNPEQLLLTDCYVPHLAFIMQYPRPAIYDAEEWTSYTKTGTWEGQKYDNDAPKAVSYVDGSIEGESLCHRWAKKDWSPDFIEEEQFLEAAAQEGVDVKAALSQQEAWGRTPLHFGLPPADSKLWAWIDEEMLTGIRCLDAGARLPRFSAYREYSRYEWSNVANGFDKGHSAVENHLYGSYKILLYYPMVSGETKDEIQREMEHYKQTWQNRIDRLCALVKASRFVLDVGILTALLELDAKAGELQRRRKEDFDENYSFWEDDPMEQLKVQLNYEFSRARASRRACLQIIDSAGVECFEAQIPAISKSIASADCITFGENGNSVSDYKKLRDPMRQSLKEISAIYEMRRKMSAAVGEQEGTD